MSEISLPLIYALESLEESMRRDVAGLRGRCRACELLR